MNTLPIGIVTYSQQYVLQSSHFNDEAYPPWREYIRLGAQVLDFRQPDDLIKIGGDPKVLAAQIRLHRKRDELLRECLAQVHGHNFVVEIEVKGVLKDGAEWVIDERALASAVESWNNANLSVHPDFTSVNARATTENMARILGLKVRDIARQRDPDLPGSVEILDTNITVWERPEIKATARL